MQSSTGQLRRRIAVLGSTGSIGRSALEVIDHLGPPFEVVALSAGCKVDLLIDQARRYKPRHVGIADSTQAETLKRGITAPPTAIYSGDACSEIAAHPDVDIVIAAIVGAAGLRPVLGAIEAGKRVALANKESLVIAGSLIMPIVRSRKIELLPIDSEHSAVFQAIASGQHGEIDRIILTASGGPFRDSSFQQIENATVEQALRHPTWSMGGKITIDSATMFNKALEVIEACWLFDLPPEKVQVVIHPQSIVHSMVEFQDGSTIAQLSPPDMKLPIQYSLTYPQRLPGCSPRLDLTTARSLDFMPPDLQRFPALRLGFEAARQKGTSGAVLNAANEIAVAAFLAGRVRFGMICRIVEIIMHEHKFIAEPTLEQLLAADRDARAAAESLIFEPAQLNGRI